MSELLPPVTKHRLTGEEPVGTDTGLTVRDFWSWAYSDLLVNTNRSVFAEFLVASALGATNRLRLEWDMADVGYGECKVEVKTSAYLQSWPQKKLSSICFDIAEKRGWNAETNAYAEARSRCADCYVFCLFKVQDPDELNVRDLRQWEFYVVETGELNQTFGRRQKLFLKHVQAITRPVPYEQLRAAVDEALKRRQNPA